MLVFDIRHKPLTQIAFIALRVKSAPMILNPLESTTHYEIADFYKKVRHHPGACQYFHDVKKRRALHKHDLIVAETLST